MRGALSAAAWIVLGLIVLTIVLLSTIGPLALKRAANDFLESSFGVEDFFDVSESESFVEYPIDLDAVTLTRDSNAAISQLLARTLECYNRPQVVGGVEDEFDCYSIDPVLWGGISREALIESLRVRDEDAASSLDGDCTGYWQEGWCVPETIDKFVGEFHITSGHSAGGFALPAVSFRYVDEGTESFTLSSDPYTASKEIAGRLARCWGIAQLGEDVVCTEFDARRLRGVVSKEDILVAISEYVDYDTREILDDWWEEDDDAFMETSISRTTPVFYACASDFDEVGAEDLCLTHDRSNDCCT